MQARLTVGVVLACLALTATAFAAAVKNPSLTGQTWQLAKLGSVDRSKAGLTVTFATDGAASGFAGCNTFTGTYAASGSSLKVSKLAATKKACRKLVMAEEDAYLLALRTARSYSVKNGALTLAARNGRTLATFRVQSQSLANSRWTVVEYNNGKGAVTSVLAGTKLSAAFDANGDIGGFAGCNDYSGRVKSDPPKIAIGPLTSTKKSCSEPAGVMDQESAYLHALGSAATYQLQGQNLELRTSAGSIAVTMQRA
jgi:heat shock protein HslJ